MFSESQRKAIKIALISPLSIITGSPGTGKTTISLAITDIYHDLYPKHLIYLASPTGRAAKRLSEATNREAKTIHRLLRYNPSGGGFEHDEGNPLYGPGLLIVDEFSMADLRLARDLFRAIPDNMQVVLVGDVDQLPSVGPGSVLRDMIGSGVVPTTRLDYVYRQAEGSGIAVLADYVRRGELPEKDELGGDVWIIECEEQEEAASVAVEEALQLIGKYGVMGCQVLAPMRKGVAGVNALNNSLCGAITGGQGAPEVTLGRETYRTGDKVMIVKNDYDKGVFNGDMGVVAAVNTGGQNQRVGQTQPKGIYVQFPGQTVFFGPDDAHEITLAYASTVHKCQGGEAPAVVMVLTRGHYIMLQRNLAYTGLTRAKKELVLVVQPGALDRAVKNDRIAERYSDLKQRLMGGSDA